MIYDALETVRLEVGEYLKSLPELDISGNAAVTLAPVAKEDGTIGIPNNHIGVSLVNIEEERLVRDITPYRVNPDNSISHQNPEMRLDLLVLFAAHFTDYKTALQYVSGLIRFFQRKSVFTPANSPTLPAGIERLVAELQSLNFEQQNHLWASLGAKYMPSVLYKIRTIRIQEAQGADEQKPITTITIAGKGKRPE